MTNSPPDSESQIQSAEAETSPTPLRCLFGAAISGGLGFLLYRLTMAIASTYANKPIASNNPLAVNIASAVRTLVMGMTALAAGIFGFATLGLVALAIQLLIRGSKRSPNAPNG